MDNYKKKSSKAYYNIVILLLILIILFSMSKLIGNKQSVDSSYYESDQVQTLSLDKEINNNEKIDNDFLKKTVQHMFPNRDIEKKYNPIFSVKDITSSILNNIFKIDIKNPLTFVQAQFPVLAAHHETVMANMPNKENNNEEIEQDWSREIHFVNYDGEEETTTVDANIDSEYYIDEDKLEEDDDLREIKEGIYIIGEDDVVDSLDSNLESNIKDIPKPKSIKVEKDKPSVLIYHTHGTESYKPAKEGNFHTLRKEYSVIAVAQTIKEELEKRGYNVIHDGTYHDYPSYNGSYGRSVVTAENILKENPSIKVVLDIHRDAYETIDSNLIKRNRIKIDGEDSSRFQFVIGGRTENKKEVEKFANFMKAVSDSKYPGFSKEPLVAQYGRYNQYLSDYSALIEVGSTTNTIEEAKKAGYYLGDVLADSLDLLVE